ncbi:MAG: response regulator transcription factor [Elusimicrobia bacterium]|nr:response regulator transcription factor [Elusimicrobiota bacterium]
MITKAKILIVEDERDIARLLRYNLEKDRYKVLVANDAESALKMVRKQHPDLIILDIMLPKMDGLEFLKTIRADNNVPVVLLTAKRSEMDRILGLKLGADDYIVKPFSVGELQARIAGHLRRASGIPAGGNGKKHLSLGAMDIDFDRHAITVKGRPAHLAPKEFAILKLLIEADGKVLSREQLLEMIWGLDKNMEIDTRTVDQHIARLRRKIRPEDERIATVPNFGYQVRLN